ncbi:hypothetical protein BH23GEM6_BH23GEM6_10220 [soil metagenome]
MADERRAVVHFYQYDLLPSPQHAPLGHQAPRRKPLNAISLGVSLPKPSQTRFANMRTAVGIFLVTVSLVSIIQSIREVVLLVRGYERYEEDSLLERPFAFGDRSFTLEDDHPYIPREPDGHTSEAGFPGTIRVMMDGAPLTERAHAIVRPGRNDLGRYHLWFDAWVFLDRHTGERKLWMAQRIQENGARFPEFEVITVSQNGALERQRLGWYQLGRNYPLFRATQFISDGSFFRMPLSMAEAVVFPVFVLVFPLGTLALGLLLLRGQSRRVQGAALVTTE